MKLASGDIGVWLIIAIIVGIGKLWNWFVSQQSDDSPEETPPVVRPKPRPQPARPVIQKKAQPPKDLREFVDRFMQPPKPVAPPVPKSAPPPPKPVATPVPSKPVPAPARASRWVEALRDRQNLRNIIISAEIIGPPRGA